MHRNFVYALLGGCFAVAIAFSSSALAQPAILFLDEQFDDLSAWTLQGVDWKHIDAVGGGTGIAASDHAAFEWTSGMGAYDGTMLLTNDINATLYGEVIISFDVELETAATSAVNNALSIEIRGGNVGKAAFSPVAAFDTHYLGASHARSITVNVSEFVGNKEFSLRIRASGPDPDTNGVWRLDNLVIVGDIGGSSLPLPVGITGPTSLTTGTENTTYPITEFEAGTTGGDGLWRITQGTLAAGLHFSAGGVLSGKPAAGTAGSTDLTFTVTNERGSSDSTTLTLTINTPGGAGSPTITTAAQLPDGTVGSPYSQTLAATGGTPGYTWSVAAGQFPPGLAMSAAGVISGTPTASGSASITITVTDTASQSASRMFNISILSIGGGTPVSITTTNLASGTIGTAYLDTVEATGGTQPYTFALAPGDSLPAGLSLAVDGEITGTPTAAGTTAFTIVVTDSASGTATRPLTIAVAPSSGAAPNIVTTSLPSATVGVFYSVPLNATGGVFPYTWALAAGTLPPAFVVETAGSITGTAQAAHVGNYNFTIRVTDSASVSSTRNFALTVAPAASGTGGTGLTSGKKGGGGCAIGHGPSSVLWLAVIGALAALGLAMRRRA